MSTIRIHDVVQAFSMTDPSHYIIGRVYALDYDKDNNDLNGEADALVVAYYDRQDQIHELCVPKENVHLLNPEDPYRNTFVPTPSADELEEHYYDTYGEPDE